MPITQDVLQSKKWKLRDMQPLQTLQVLSENTKQIFQICVGKEVTILKAKKRDRPKLIPEEIMKKAIQTSKALRLKGAPISYNVINAIAKGIVVANDRAMLVEHGGH